ncbi:uncharacterized protein LOC109398234 [Aedes albopictus]|uniref:Uncharacterized protein n=1 Tax=Aedes albopictus TaxID=7160 RepID=A0ABM1XKS2_AEDAL
MAVVNTIWHVLAGLAIVTVTVAGDCISFEDHKEEILNCCKYHPPYPKDEVRECLGSAQAKSGGDKHQFFVCLLECYLPRIGVIDGESINEGRIAEHMQSLDENARNILLEAYKECAGKTTGAARGQCNSYAFDLETCVLQKIDMECPAEFYNPGPICDQLKSGTEICH